MNISTTRPLMQLTMGQAQGEAAAAPAAITRTDFRIPAIANAPSSNMCIGPLGATLCEGYAAAKAVEGIARNPQSAPANTRPMNIGQAVPESITLYALVSPFITLFPLA